MKTNITLNARPLFRALYVLLFMCTAFLAMPRPASAQIYVSQFTPGVVGEYDEKTGEVINASFITGLTGPNEIILKGDDLLIAEVGGVVGKYNAKTGAAISQSFITGTNFVPVGLAVSGEDLFVASAGDGTVGKYNVNTGKAIKLGLITGLPTGPGGDVVFGLGVLGADLFVTNTSANAVVKFNARTGKAIGTPLDLAEPYGIAFHAGKIFVCSTSSDAIAEYTDTGKLVNANFITGLEVPFLITILGDTLFVTEAGLGAVGTYNVKTGAVINLGFVSGLNDPVGIAVKAQSK
jgi:WD40 repeat protein